MSDTVMPEAALPGGDRWEYKVIKVSVGNVTFQRYGPESFPFEATLNDLGKAGWEAFHAQAIAENEALLVFLKRRVAPAL
jgi:hypothetical protein